jgi:hypothetical protein
MFGVCEALDETTWGTGRNATPSRIREVWVVVAAVDALRVVRVPEILTPTFPEILAH